MPAYDTYDYVEITTSPRFGRSRTFTHHNLASTPRNSQYQYQYQQYPSTTKTPSPPRPRTRCPPACASISLEAWNAQLQQTRTSRAEAQALTESLRGTTLDLHRAQALQAEESAKHKRRLAQFREELEVREAALRDLRKARDLAETRVRELTRTVTDQGTENEALRDEAAALRRACERARSDLAVRSESANEAWSVVADLRRQLRGSAAGAGAGGRGTGEGGERRSGGSFFRRPYGFGSS